MHINKIVSFRPLYLKKCKIKGHGLNNLKSCLLYTSFQMDADKKESSELASLILTKDFFKKIIVRMEDVYKRQRISGPYIHLVCAELLYDLAV